MNLTDVKKMLIVVSALQWAGILYFILKKLST